MTHLPTTTILALTTSSGLGGAEQVLLDAIDAGTGLPVSFHVVLPVFGPMVSELRDRTVPYTILSFGRSLGELSQYRGSGFRRRIQAAIDLVVYRRKFRQLCRRTSPDVVYTHGNKTQFLAAICLLGLPVKLIWHVHVFPPDGWLRSVFRLLGRRADWLVANSQAVADRIPEEFRPKTSVVYCPILNSRYTQIARTVARRELCLDSLPAECRLVGMVTVLAPWKGIDVFLRAVAPILKERDNLHAVICGGVIYQTLGHANYDDELRQLTRLLEIDSKVSFIPFQRDPSRVYSALDLLVHASKDPEPFGRIVSESRLCGTPVIATAGGGVLEQVEDSVTGWLVPMNDVEGLKKKLRMVLEDKALRISVASKGQAWVKSNLTLEKFRTALYQIILFDLASPNQTGSHLISDALPPEKKSQ